MDKREVAVMRVLDGLWESHEWVPADLLEAKVAFNPRRVRAIVRDLKTKGFVSWVSSGKLGAPSIKLKERGKDALAIWDLMKHDVIDELGHVVGEGKESAIVLGFKEDQKVALKFHRYYSGEFIRIKDSLAYTAIKWWKKRTFGLGSNDTRPIIVERAKAQIEFRTLEKLTGKVNVPRPLGINRHVVAMEFLGGDLPASLLTKVRGDKSEYKDVAEEAAFQYEKAVKKGIVHGDMSEYNVVVWRDRPWLIDWPQAVPVEFPGSDKLLERDRMNLKKMVKKFS